MFVLRSHISYRFSNTLKLFLCLTVLLSSLFIPNCNNSLSANTKALGNEDTWTYYDNENEYYPYVDFSPFTSTEQKDYFSIYTSEQLAAVAVLVNHQDKSATLRDSKSNCVSPRSFEDEIIMLKSDIDLGAHLWEPIGFNNTNVFRGSFDGGKKSIKNLFIGGASNESPTYSYIGLFGKVSGNISNVFIGNAKVYAKENQIQSFYAGLISGYTSGNIINCHTDEDSYIYYMICSGHLKDYVGGISGMVFNGNISNCETNNSIFGFFNDGSHNSLVFIGGITGSCTLSKIEKCVNKSDITDCQNHRHIGGITGQVYCDGEIYNCYNYGFLRINRTSSDYPYDDSVSRAGSIAGSISGFEFHKVDINRCGNFGNVYSFEDESIKNFNSFSSSSVFGGWDHVVHISIRNCYSKEH